MPPTALPRQPHALRARLHAPRLTAIALLLAALGGAQAQTWTGAGFSNGWMDNLNWQGLARPASSATTAITFAGGARLSPVQNIAPAFTLNSITFASSAGSFAVSGNILRFAGNNAQLVQNSANAVSIANGMQLATAVVIDGAGDLTLTGILARQADIDRSLVTMTKRGTGSLTLTGASFFDAVLRITAGRVLVRNELALANATVQLDVGNGLSFGSLAQATLGGLTGSGALALGTTALTVGNADSTGLYSGAITGTTATITKAGSGTARWAGTSQVDRLQVTAGRLQLEGGGLTLTNAGEGLMVGSGSATTGSIAALALSGGATASAAGTTTQVDGIAGTALALNGTGSRLSTGFQTLIGNHGSGRADVGGGGTLAAGTFLLVGWDNGGQGTLAVNAGGTVTGNVGVLGGLTGATGAADVTGVGALWSTSALGIGGLNDSLRGGTGTLTVRDGGQVQVSGALSFWSAGAGATVDGGSLRAGALTSLGAVGRITLAADPADGQALTLGGSAGSHTYSGDIDGDGGLLKTSSNTQVLAGRNSFTGLVQVQAGTLQLANSSASEYAVTGGTLRLGERSLGAAVVHAAGGQVVYTNTTLSGGTLIGANGHDISTVRRLVGTRVGGGGMLAPASGTTFVGVVNDGTVDIQTGRSLTWTSGSNPTGTVNLAGSASVSSFRSGGLVTVAPGGTLISTSGDLVLGGGSRTLVGSASQPGGTIELQAGGRLQVNGGLLVNNGQIQGPVELNFGSLAKGAGAYGTVVVNDGGRFSPGNSPGTVSTGDATWGAGGSLLVELAAADGTAGIDWDLWTVHGDLGVLSGTTANSRFTISLQTLDGSHQAAPLAGFDPHRACQWQIVDTTDGIVGFDPARVALDTQGFLSPLAGGTLRLAVQDGDIWLQFAPVPEPQTWALLLGGLGVLGWSARRRRPAAR